MLPPHTRPARLTVGCVQVVYVVVGVWVPRGLAVVGKASHRCLFTNSVVDVFFHGYNYISVSSLSSHLELVHSFVTAVELFFHWFLQEALR